MISNMPTSSTSQDKKPSAPATDPRASVSSIRTMVDPYKQGKQIRQGSGRKSAS